MYRHCSWLNVVPKALGRLSWVVLNRGKAMATPVLDSIRDKKLEADRAVNRRRENWRHWVARFVTRFIVAEYRLLAQDA